MSELDRDKWNQRYAEDSQRKNNPVTLLQEWLPRLRTGKALDVACGAGRNSIFLAQQGFQVDAVDISPVGLELARHEAERLGLEINWIEQDLDRPCDFDTDYDLIVVLWYVNLPLITRLCGCLAPGGYLLCEEHLVTDQQVVGPTSPRFRVLPGALSRAVAGLEIELYEESVVEDIAGEPLASARVVARRR